MISTDVAGKNQLLGDMLCLGGAVLFAVVSVAQELLVKTLDWVEYLGMVGLLGSILSIVQTYVLLEEFRNGHILGLGAPGNSSESENVGRQI
jgi:drug/metabolite transporter (DMT)-like permease